jgi:hypothetical protein
MGEDHTEPLGPAAMDPESEDLIRLAMFKACGERCVRCRIPLYFSEMGDRRDRTRDHLDIFADMRSSGPVIGFLRTHLTGVILGGALAGAAVFVAALYLATAAYQSSGPETIASSALAKEAADDARLYVNPHIESVTCPRGTFRAGSHLLCKAELWVGPSQRKTKLLSVAVTREEGEISATISPDRFVEQSAGG